MVALHRFQTSLKELSTLPSIFSFKKTSEWGFARVGYAKENKSLLGTGGRGPLALEVITGCPVPGAESAAGNLRRFLLPCCGLTHQHNVRRKNTENMSHMLIKQTEQRAWLASGCSSGLVLEEPPMLSTLGHQLPLLCPCGLSHAFPLLCQEVARVMPNSMQPRTQYHSAGQPWPVANKKPFLQTGFHSKSMVRQGADCFWHSISEETVVASSTHRHSTGLPGNKVKMNSGNMNYFAVAFCGAYLKWQWEPVILSRCMCHFCGLLVLVIKEEGWQRWQVFTGYPEHGKGHIFTCFSLSGQHGAFQPIPLLPALCQPQV